jgi:hypothetical protein
MLDLQFGNYELIFTKLILKILDGIYKIAIHSRDFILDLDLLLFWQLGNSAGIGLSVRGENVSGN